MLTKYIWCRFTAFQQYADMKHADKTQYRPAVIIVLSVVTLKHVPHLDGMATTSLRNMQISE